MSIARISSGFASFEEAAHALLNSPDSDVRETAATALGKTCSEEAIPLLIQALRKESHGYIRTICAGYLGSLRGDGCKEALIQALEDKDAGVRKRAVTGLARYHQADGYAAIEKLQEDPSSDVRFQVQRALKARDIVRTSTCPYFSPQGFCDPPGVPQLEDCSWDTNTRGHHNGCAVYQMLGYRERIGDRQARREKQRRHDEQVREEEQKRAAEEAHVFTHTLPRIFLFGTAALATGMGVGAAAKFPTEASWSDIALIGGFAGILLLAGLAIGRFRNWPRQIGLFLLFGSALAAGIVKLLPENGPSHPFNAQAAFLYVAALAISGLLFTMLGRNTARGKSSDH